MKKRFEKFQKCVAIVASLAMATGMAMVPMSASASDSYDSEETVKTVRGDLNGDGLINGFDMVMLRKYFISWNQALDEIADLNYDGEVNIADAVLLQKFLLGKIKSFQDDGPFVEKSGWVLTGIHTLDIMDGPNGYVVDVITSTTPFQIFQSNKHSSSYYIVYYKSEVKFGYVFLSESMIEMGEIKPYSF